MARTLIDDAELVALASIVQTMAELDPATQQRVVGYLQARYAPPSSSSAPVPAFPAAAPDPIEHDGPWGA
jgi:hypothetical protein